MPDPPRGASEITRLLRGIRIDTTPLHSSRDFRLVFSAGLITLFGSFITMIAAPLQLKELTGSYVAVGLVGAVEFVPLMIFGLWGRRSRRHPGPAQRRACQ